MNIPHGVIPQTSAAHINSSTSPSSFQKDQLSKSTINDDQQHQEQQRNNIDKVTLSETGKKQSLDNNNQNTEAKTQNNSNEQSSKDQQEVQKLQQRDREVRSHEQAHLANAGQYARGGASFSYTTGPNGKRYASGGEVPIDTSKEKTPEETIQKMQAIRRAALAPANPSGADRNIASSASKKEAEARSELQEETRTTSQSEAEDKPAIEDENTINTSATGQNTNKSDKTNTFTAHRI